MNIVYESNGEPLAFEKFACELFARASPPGEQTIYPIALRPQQARATSVPVARQVHAGGARCFG
jgi:hypothetical protein